MAATNEQNNTKPRKVAFLTGITGQVCILMTKFALLK